MNIILCRCGICRSMVLDWILMPWAVIARIIHVKLQAYPDALFISLLMPFSHNQVLMVSTYLYNSIWFVGEITSLLYINWCVNLTYSMEDTMYNFTLYQKWCLFLVFICILYRQLLVLYSLRHSCLWDIGSLLTDKIAHLLRNPKDYYCDNILRQISPLHPLGQYV